MSRAAAPLQSAAPTSSGRLAIGAMRLRVRHGQGQLPPRMPDGTALAKAMREALTGLVDPADGSFWVIRSLRLPSGACDKNDASVLAALVAAQVGKALRKVLRGELVEGVRRFPDRSAWLAELMLDHVRGAARGHWLYASRSGYDAVPPQLLPRMVLLDDPATAIEALALMQRSGQLADLVAPILRDRGYTVVEVSAVAHDGLKALGFAMAELVLAARAAAATADH